jgi:hypothetical protein
MARLETQERFLILNMMKFTKHVSVRLGSETSEQPMRENSLLWIGSRACSHKNGIFDWVVVFVSFNTKRKKEFKP